MYPKRIKSYDFGDAKYSQSQDEPTFVGRRVDYLIHSIDAIENEDVEISLQSYLMDDITETARLIAAKVLLLLEPNCGQ